MNSNPFSEISSLIEMLEKGQESNFPHAHANKPYCERFKELDNYFSGYDVEMGALQNEIIDWKNKLRSAVEAVDINSDDRSKIELIENLLDEDTMSFLNKHGHEHVVRVQEKALEIIRCFTDRYPSCYEVFFLLCAISVHDIGNFFGRTNHEKKIPALLDKDCKNIIDDSIERKIIGRIAGVHGGNIKGSKDTISFLSEEDVINNIKVREQMLASILRFADELADDNTRANHIALDWGILGKASEIYHVYSSKLHTVKLEQNPLTCLWRVVLKYEFSEEVAKKQYNKGGEKVYLLDEIYDRTIKMERERRYCMRFLRGYCAIESISVEIRIVNERDVFEERSINYSLKEEGYPEKPFCSIKDVDKDIVSGKEMAEQLLYLSGEHDDE